MKMLFFNLMLILSVSLMAGSNPYEGEEKEIKKYLEKNNKSITDNIVVLENISYDIEIYGNHVFLALKVKSIGAGNDWHQFNKKKFHEFIKNITDKIRIYIKKPHVPIYVSVDIEEYIYSDKLVYYEEF